MKLGFEWLKAVIQGVSYMENTPEGVIFHRFSKAQEEAYDKRGNKDFFAKCAFCAGVKLAFRTDSEKLFIKGTLRTTHTERMLYAFDLLINGELSDTLTNMPADFDPHTPKRPLPVGDFEKEFELGGGEKFVELYFPWSSMVIMKEVGLDDGAAALKEEEKK